MTATLGVQGHRPLVGTRDGKDLRSVFAVVNRLRAALPTNTLESPHDAKKKTGTSTTRRRPEACAAQRRPGGRLYPRGRPPRGVRVIDHAPWPRGRLIDAARRDKPHLEFKRLPSYSPQFNPIERLGKKRRRRATPNRLFATLADLKASVRARLCYVQTMRPKVQSSLEGRPRKQAVK